MPVARVSMSERAYYPVDRDSSCDERVVIHIRVIVEIDEIVPKSLAKHQPGNRDQSEADEKNKEPRFLNRRGRLGKRSSLRFSLRLGFRVTDCHC